MKRRTHLTVALILLASASAHAQEPAPASESSCPAEIQCRVDAIFAEYYQPGSPGCALAVMRDGQVVYQQGYGSANLDYELPITPDSVFYLASVSKQFVAACIALLAQEGKLSLDDDVRKHVPELPDYGTTITLRHLVHHTSGLRDYLTLMQLAGLRWEDVHDEKELLALICRQKELNFQPGEQHRYSNTGYFLLAEVVKRASGKTLRRYANENIFGPLGMQNTHFHDNRVEIVKNRVTGYRRSSDGGYRVYFPANWDQVGSGGLYSTVSDLARWDQNFYDAKVGGPGFLATMHSQTTLNDGTELVYAFGLAHGEYNGLKTVSHTGGFQGFRTVLLHFPEASFSVVVLSNFAEVDPTALARKVADLNLAARFAAALERYIGDYRSEELQATYKVARTETGLTLKRPSAACQPLLSTGDLATFSASGLELLFSEDDRGLITGFSVSSGRTTKVRFVRILPASP